MRNTLTTQEAAKACGTSPSTFRRWIYAGRIKSHSSPDAGVYITTQAVRRFLSAHNKTTDALDKLLAEREPKQPLKLYLWQKLGDQTAFWLAVAPSIDAARTAVMRRAKLAGRADEAAEVLKRRPVVHTKDCALMIL